ncbi:hypothetical protein NFI96_029602, partial [Prochilodus magdalenae]
RSCEDMTEMSQDDRQFMKDVEQSCQFDGHYCISLPFKDRLPTADEFFSCIPEKERAAEMKDLDLSKDALPT